MTRCEEACPPGDISSVLGGHPYGGKGERGGGEGLPIVYIYIIYLSLVLSVGNSRAHWVVAKDQSNFEVLALVVRHVVGFLGRKDFVPNVLVPLTAVGAVARG